MTPGPAASPSFTVRDNAEAGRYEIHSGDALAGFSDYRDRVGRRIFVHTEVDPAFSGKGVATRLIADALDDALAKGMRVIPRCPFVRAYLERHPDHPANRPAGGAAAEDLSTT